MLAANLNIASRVARMLDELAGRGTLDDCAGKAWRNTYPAVLDRRACFSPELQSSRIPTKFHTDLSEQSIRVVLDSFESFRRTHRVRRNGAGDVCRRHGPLR